MKKSIINYKKTGFIDLSSEAKNFITSLIQKDQEKRLSAAEALDHPWIKKYEVKQAEPVFLK